MIQSLCVVRKMFSYMNMCVDHVMPCRTRRYASLSVGVICRPSKGTHPSASFGLVYITVSIPVGIGCGVPDGS